MDGPRLEALPIEELNMETSGRGAQIPPGSIRRRIGSVPVEIESSEDGLRWSGVGSRQSDNNHRGSTHLVGMRIRCRSRNRVR